MLYRKLGKTELSVSILGFGAMRLPFAGGSTSALDAFNPNKKIDEEETTKMIEFAVSRGVNYFDTAYVYHAGQSEVVLGKALKPFRDKVFIATKLPTMVVKEASDFERTFEEQLKRLDTGFVDVYLVHALNRPVWHKMKELGMLRFLDRVQADGRARHIGISFHDDVRIFKEIVDGYDWKLCQIQYNYYDEDTQAGKEGLLYAASKGLGVVVMEPIRGGRLADPIPDEARAIWNSAGVKRTPGEWALRWVWNQAEVSTALSGMSTMNQVIENIRIADEGKPNTLTPNELSLIQQARQVYRKMLKVDCTGCAYCMPCETGVNIPAVFSLYNDLYASNAKEIAPVLYSITIPPGEQASACTECLKCEEKCPQHIEIRDELKKAHELLYREGLLQH